MKLGVIGANTIAEMAISICESADSAYECLLFDDDSSKQGKGFSGVTVVGTTRDLGNFDLDGLVICFGERLLGVRQSLFEKLKDAFKFVNLIHPKANIEDSASIGMGNIVGPLCYIGRETSVGHNNVFWASATVEHNCVIGNSCYFGPNCTLSGFVQVKSKSLIGSGAVILPSKIINENSLVGAGSVVTVNTQKGTTVFGSPAKIHW